MIYVVQFRDGSVQMVEKNDFAEVNINEVQVVYPGNVEVEVTMELVPQGEEQNHLAETVETFRSQYAGDVVTEEGMVSFAEWFENASTGDKAVIPEKALVPVKTYKVVKIKTGVEVKPKKQVQPPTEEVKEKKEPENSAVPVNVPDKPASRPGSSDHEGERKGLKENKEEKRDKKKDSAQDRKKEEVQPKLFGDEKSDDMPEPEVKKKSRKKK